MKKKIIITLGLLVATASGILVFRNGRTRTQTTHLPGPKPEENLVASDAGTTVVPRTIGAQTRDVAGLPAKQLYETMLDKAYSPTTRNNAANILLNKRDDRLAQALIQMLSDQSEDVTWRNYCVQFLRGSYAQNPDADVLAALFSASSNSEPEISSCAIWSLAQLAGPPGTTTNVPDSARQKCIELALSALQDERSPLLLRAAGAQSCSKMEVVESLPELRKIADSERADVTLRTIAIAALGQVKDTGSVSILERLTHSRNGRVAKAAESAGNELLGKIANEDPPSLAADLLKMIDDEKHTPRWRNYCVQHLANHYIKHRDPASYAGLLKAAKSKTHEVAEVAVFSLPRAARALALKEDDPFYRDSLRAIREALYDEPFLAGGDARTKGGRTTTTGAEASPTYNHPNVRIAAIRGIGLLKLDSFVPELNGIAVSSANPIQVRVAAVDVIGLLNAPDSRSLLEKLSRDSSRNLSAAASRALARLDQLAKK